MWWRQLRGWRGSVPSGLGLGLRLGLVSDRVRFRAMVRVKARSIFVLHAVSFAMV